MFIAEIIPQIILFIKMKRSHYISVICENIYYPDTKY